MKEKPIIDDRAPEIDLQRFYNFLLRYRWYLLIATAGMVIVSLAFIGISALVPPAHSLLPDTYKAVSLLLINEQGTNNLLASAQGLSTFLTGSSLSGALATNFSLGELTMQLLRSKTVLDTIALEFDLAIRYKIKGNKIGKSREQIIKYLSLAYDEKSRLLSIAYEDYDPQIASRIVNRFVELLDQRFLALGGNRNADQLRLLEKNLVEVKAKIAVLEGEFKSFQVKYGVLNIDTLAEEQVTLMARLRSQLILKEMEIKTYADFSHIEDPVLKRLKVEAENLKNLIREMESGYSEYNRILPNQRDLSDLALDFSHKQRDLSVQEKIYEILTHQYELLKLSMSDTEPTFQVVEIADIPDLKIGPRRSILVLISCIGSLLINIVCAFLYHIIRKVIAKPVEELPGTSEDDHA